MSAGELSDVQLDVASRLRMAVDAYRRANQEMK